MNKQLQTIYIPTKVEDSKFLPEINYVFITKNKDVFQDRFDKEQILEQLPQKMGFDLLKPTEAYIFTPDELKQLLSDTFDKGRDYQRDFGVLNSKEIYIEKLLKK